MSAALTPLPTARAAPPISDHGALTLSPRKIAARTMPVTASKAMQIPVRRLADLIEHDEEQRECSPRSRAPFADQRLAERPVREGICPRLRHRTASRRSRRRDRDPRRGREGVCAGHDTVAQERVRREHHDRSAHEQHARPRDRDLAAADGHDRAPGDGERQRDERARPEPNPAPVSVSNTAMTAGYA